MIATAAAEPTAMPAVGPLLISLEDDAGVGVGEGVEVDVVDCIDEVEVVDVELGSDIVMGPTVWL